MVHQNYAGLYDGTIAEVRSTSEADMATAQSQAKKPAKRTRRRSPRSPESEEVAQKGKRGRPRVDTQDESAVERRRTQIRLAQRAYRERKETTISALEKRVAELQETISEMNQTFIEYNDKAVASGIINIDPTLGQQLKVTTERFLGLAQVGSQESDAEGTGGLPRREPLCAGERTTPSKDSTRQVERSTPMQEHTSLVPIPPVSVLGYEVTYETTSPVNESSMNTRRQAGQEEYAEYSTRGSSWDDPGMNLQQYRAEVPEVPIMTPYWNFAADTLLKPTTTYSFQESTFGRRLLRASYESAFRFLTMADPPPRDINRLRYTLCFGPPKAIARRIGPLLQKSTKESLENWDFPLLHIGNSGLHFPRSSLDSEEPLPDYWSQTQSIGPYPPKTPWVHVPESEYPGNLVQWANIEGTWFDANDVEQYLKSKGLSIDERASLAEIEVDEPLPGLEFVTGSPTSLSTESATDPQSPPHGDILPVLDLFSQNAAYMPDVSGLTSAPYLQTTSYDFMATGNTDNPMAWTNTSAAKSHLDLDLCQSGMLPEFNMFDFVPRKRKLTIDVDRLLNELNDKAVCLGRAPGYRQNDIDAALKKVMQEAY